MYRSAGLSLLGRAKETTMTGLMTRNYDDLFGLGLPGFGRMFADFDRLFRELDQRPLAAAAPEVRTKNGPEGYELAVDLPGLTQSDVHLEVHREVLTVSGKRDVQAPEGYRAHRRERRAYQFSRSFTLPEDADTEQVSANMKNGVLTVTVAKRPEVKPRQIPVAGA
jgi:HSP20 family protein